MGLVLQELQLLGAAEERGRTQENPQHVQGAPSGSPISTPEVTQAFPSLVLHGCSKVLVFTLQTT